jgi:hypothetical protein
LAGRLGLERVYLDIRDIYLSVRVAPVSRAGKRRISLVGKVNIKRQVGERRDEMRAFECYSTSLLDVVDVAFAGCCCCSSAAPCVCVPVKFFNTSRKVHKIQKGEKQQRTYHISVCNALRSIPLQLLL